MGSGDALTAAVLIDALSERGIELWFEGDRLRFRAPKGAMTAELRAEVSARRGEVVAHLRACAAETEMTWPLSFSQRSLWMSHQQMPESAANHLAMPIEICSDLDVQALRQALQALVDRHGTLRTTYAMVDGEPVQLVAGTYSPNLDIYNVPDAGRSELRIMVEDDYRRPFDLANGPIFRSSLFTRHADQHVLLLAFHHIAVDAWSMLLLVEELFALYAEGTGRSVTGLPRPEIAYTDYVRWQQEWLAGPESDRHWSYWQSKLALPLAQLDLLTDRLRPTASRMHGASVQLEAGAALTKKVKDLALQEGTTPFVVLLAAFKVLLHQLSGTEDVVVGTPLFARSRPEFLRVAGNFVNSLALRSHVGQRMSFIDLIVQLRQTVLEAIDAQEFPLPLIVQRLQPKREAGRSPLFDTLFRFLRFEQFSEVNALLMGSAADEPVELAGLRLRPYPIHQQEGQFELSLHLLERTEGLVGAFMYRTDVFEETTIRRFADHYLALLGAVTVHPTVALEQLPKISAVVLRPDDNIGLLLDQLEQRDVRLSLEGDRLRINAPRGALDDELKAKIAAQRDDIIARLRLQNEREILQGHGRDVIQIVPRTGALPVSAAQQRLWFLDQMDPGNSQYNIGGGLRLQGNLDVGVLKQAIHALTIRHESFRTSIGERNGRPWLTISDTSCVSVDVLDLSERPADEREVLAREAGERLLRTPFDMARGPLAAFLILRLGDDDHMLFIAMHHIVSDGWSLSIACHELCALYEAGLAGRPADLPCLSVGPVDYAGWEAEQIRSGGLDEHLEYWKRHLQGAPAALALPTDRKRPPIPSHRGGRLRRYLDGGLIAALEQRSREHGATLFMTLMAAWQVLMYRHSGQDDVVIGTPMANRDNPMLEGIIGCLVNNVVMRGHLGGNPRFDAFLEQVKQTTLAAFDHRMLPFDHLVQGLNPERNASHAPIFQVLFTLMSFPVRSIAPAGLAADLVPLDSAVSRFDLSIELNPITTGGHSGEYSASYDYDSDLFDALTISRMHEHFDNMLRAIAADPSCRIDELPLLGQTDEYRSLADWNRTFVQHDRTRCVHHLLEASARSSPDAVAVIAGSLSVDYRTLDESANRLAHLLGARGIGRGALVAVCLERTADIPMVLAAVLKAGAAYVPLDPTHPEERLHYILEDAEISCVITTSSLRPIFNSIAAEIVLLDEVHELLQQQPAAAPPVAVQPDDLAYVIYTSGSTGRPKGVEIEHRNVVSFLEAMRREPGLTSSDRLLAVTTLAFDIAGLEIWLPLSVGATTVIASRTDALDGIRLASLIDRHEITVLQATPASWRLLIASGWTGSRSLKALCGGEALPADLAAALVDRTAELWNMYGPTETTIWSTVGRTSDPTKTITIGRPIANTQTFILEASGQLAPAGVVGELCIGGEGVARGYRKRPELTAEKFVSMPLPDGQTVRLYRTGDLARYRSSGELELLGRRDFQVKVRGYRVELGEIESVLMDCPGLKSCVVVARAFAPNDERLVAYVTLQDGTVFDAETVRITLRRRLPEYMIPALFVVLPALPLTPNNKIDRNALPPPQMLEGRSDMPSNVLMTPSQRRVAEVWQEVLQVGNVGLNENFFDLGGHSLLLVKLHARLKQVFAVDFPLIELFQRTTVSGQAERLSSHPRSDEALMRARTRAERQFHGRNVHV
jgi:amino acid adenylation domain-containing protein